MIGLIAWSVFLLLCIIALPIASVIDKRKMRAAFGPMDDDYGAQEEIMEEPEEAADFVEEEIPAEIEEVAVEGGGDFSAFDEDF